ncbi:hypothetical protein [Aquimarina litoralis]|uniref:hypothetical protein n=1 Tax=Aquimarina litoralis TaxID=584605 RepID=UPI001C594BE4|nr:hypothetical protein [Aquimarina litoralis]MBW1296003.1 hypothetical protein [Aquimarina litoralis]
MIEQLLRISLLGAILLTVSCGSDDGDDTNTAASCELMLLTGQPCDYSEFQNIELTKGFFIEVGPSDFINTDGVTHFLRKIIFSDGDLTLDEFGDIKSDNATAYVEFFLYSLGTEQFNPGTFRPWAFVDASTSSFISLAGDLTYDCTSGMNGLTCDSRIGQGDAIVVVSNDGGEDQVCFDFLTFGSSDCVRGTFSGELMELTAN